MRCCCPERWCPVPAGTMSVSDIVRFQIDHHCCARPIIPGLPASSLFAAMIAEANRIPLTSPRPRAACRRHRDRVHGMKFALYISEYAHARLVRGGRRSSSAAGTDRSRPAHTDGREDADPFARLLIRWTLPVRSDQLLALCWKWLVPIPSCPCPRRGVGAVRPGGS
jgi:hypothetical protein